MTFIKELKSAMLSATLLFAFGTATADPITILGEDDPANNSAVAELSASDATTVTITVANTSNFSALVTSIAFDLFDGLADTLIKVTGSRDDSGWSFSSDGDRGNGGPFDLDLESYALTGRSVNGGNPRDAIVAGTTGIFEFGGEFGSNVAISSIWARFQQTGADGEGSDYGWGCIEPDDCERTNNVPEPGSLALLGLGLVLTGMARGRRRRK